MFSCADHHWHDSDPSEHYSGEPGHERKSYLSTTFTDAGHVLVTNCAFGYSYY